MGRWHAHASVYPVRFTSIERAPCIILLVGAAHYEPDILKEPLVELPGPALSGIGVGIAGLLIARALLGFHILLKVGCQSNNLGLVIWNRLVPTGLYDFN